MQAAGPTLEETLRILMAQYEAGERNPDRDALFIIIDCVYRRTVSSIGTVPNRVQQYLAEGSIAASRQDVPGMIPPLEAAIAAADRAKTGPARRLAKPAPPK